MRVRQGASLRSGSVSLLADTIDFFGDAGNDAISLAVLGMTLRTGDASMRPVWICSRNDALGNIAVMLAALGVFGTGQSWPELLVGAIMGMLALTGASSVLGAARRELRQPAPAQAPAPAAVTVKFERLAKK